MSGYQYRATREERVAAELLRAKGWRVSEPACPKCRGFGWIAEGVSWGTGVYGGGSQSIVACPRGCQPAAFYTLTNGAVAAPVMTNAIAGPVVGNRGVR